MSKPRARHEYGLWLVRGDGAAGCAVRLDVAYQRWVAQHWMLNGGLQLVIDRARTQGTLERLMEHARRLP